jgi:hypothetical protein
MTRDRGMTAWTRARRALAGAMAVIVSLAVPVAAENTPGPPEYLIKAAYLYNFAMFVEWPGDAFASPDAPLVIGIVGRDPFGSAIDHAVENKRISRRRIVVERLQLQQDLRHCQILFVAASERTRIGELSQRLQSQPVLIVDDAPEPGKRAGSVEFVVNDNKVGFAINLDAARRARLVISSKMLGLAKTVR